jgi:predicted neuraminidase
MYSDGYSFGIMAISDDGGATWTASQPLVGNGCIQPSVVRKQDGTLIAYMRDNGPPPKRVLYSTSKDEGVTWSTAEDSEIFNPGTSLEAIRLRNGNWVMVHNDLEKGRYSLAIALSEDEGKTWRWKRHLDGDPSKKVPNQYHYPSVIQSADGFIHVTYSYFTPEGKAIKHARLNEDWIRQSR